MAGLVPGGVVGVGGGGGVAGQVADDGLSYGGEGDPLAGHAGVFGAAVGEVAQGLVDGQVSGYLLVDAVGAV